VERFNFGRFAGDASQRVHSIVSAAETEAAGLLRDAEREADLIRREAQAESERILDDARVRADDLITERMQRIAELSDGIVEQTELLFDHFGSADQVRRQLDGLLRSLGEAAEAVSREASTRRPAAARPAQPRPSTPQTSRPSVRPAEPPVAPSYREPAPVTPAPPRRPDPLDRAPEPPPPTTNGPAVEDPTDARFDGARLVALQMAVAGSTREEVAAELQRAFRLQDPSSILDDVFGARRTPAAS
jgi:hypothetical protein